MQSPNNVYGSYNEKTGTWSGSVHELQQNRSDIAVGMLDITESRHRVVDFFPPINRQR